MNVSQTTTYEVPIGLIGYVAIITYIHSNNLNPTAAVFENNNSGPRKHPAKILPKHHAPATITITDVSKH
jgi:hypothetical protein